MTILALICLSFAALLALIYLVVHAGGPPSPARSAIKTGAVAALVPVAALSGAPGTIVAGLALGAAGDFFLSRPGQGAFLAGMAAFAAGHLAYVLAFIGFGAHWPGALVTIVLGALWISTEFWLIARTGALRWPVRGYIVVILAMMLAASGLEGRYWPLILGAASFLLSDLILACEIFVLPEGKLRQRATRALWVFYWAGQALIALAAVLAALPSGTGMN